MKAVKTLVVIGTVVTLALTLGIGMAAAKGGNPQTGPADLPGGYGDGTCDGIPVADGTGPGYGYGEAAGDVDGDGICDRTPALDGTGSSYGPGSSADSGRVQSRWFYRQANTLRLYQGVSAPGDGVCIAQ
ncbi:MAG: hypothetical protein Kow00124_01630 [Anaerolineae bacterium]